MIKIWKPEPKQEIALMSTADEVLYGGARGGGKTDTALQWFLYNIDDIRYRGLVIRRNATDLTDFIDRAIVKYTPLGAKKKGQPPEIHFLSGAKIYTGHMKDAEAYTKYQGWEIHRLLIEEVTHIPSEEQYLKLLGSVRSTVPELKPQVFLTTNPDGIGHDWVKKRFRIGEVKPCTKFTAEDGRTRIYIPATVYDNPYLVSNDPNYINI